MTMKQHKKQALGQDDWMDPLYLDELLTDEEKSIRKTTKDYCKSKYPTSEPGRMYYYSLLY